MKICLDPCAVPTICVPLYFCDMTLASLLSLERVIPEMQSEEQFPAIDELVGSLLEGNFLDESKKEAVLRALYDREEQRSTGIGGGIAIPHCFLEDLDEVVAIFGRSSKGIDFCALDCAPVHFVLLFIVPKSQYTLHLKTLAAIAKILNSAETREKLTQAETSKEILEILWQKSV